MMDPLPIAYTFLSFLKKKVKSYRIIPRKKVFVNKRKPSNVLKNKISPPGNTPVSRTPAPPPP
jgi:hypothetical protein